MAVPTMHFTSERKPKLKYIVFLYLVTLPETIFSMDCPGPACPSVGGSGIFHDLGIINSEQARQLDGPHNSMGRPLDRVYNSRQPQYMPQRPQHSPQQQRLGRLCGTPIMNCLTPNIAPIESQCGCFQYNGVPVFGSIIK